MGLKWYEHRIMTDGEMIPEWSSNRNRKGVCCDIHQIFFTRKFRLFVCGKASGDFDTLIDAQNAGQAIWEEGNA